MADGTVPTKLPTTRTTDYGAQVRKAWGDQWHKREPAYEFSNGRKFDDSGPNAGIYSGTSG